LKLLREAMLSQKTQLSTGEEISTDGQL
jgi:hypothetical protein